MKNILIAGSDGFIGRSVYAALNSENRNVIGLSRPGLDSDYSVDLLDYDQVVQAMKSATPDVVINCAGVVAVDGVLDANKMISTNLLRAAISTNTNLKRFIMCGSAGVYGVVDVNDYPIKETQPLRATQPYPLSKIAEEDAVRMIGKAHNIDTIVARIFNPVGPGMAPRFLIPGILRQIDDIRHNKADHIEVGRLDAERDYVAVNDVARAISLLALAEVHQYDTYNIGSGTPLKNSQLVDLILSEMTMNNDAIKIIETSSVPEQPIASHADISRMKEEFGWEPNTSLQDMIKGVVSTHEADIRQD